MKKNATANTVRVAWDTHIGLVRGENQDAGCVINLDTGVRAPRGTVCEIDTKERGCLFLVCDGLGGAKGGATASQTASRHITDEMLEGQETTDTNVFARLLRRSIRAANHELFIVSRVTPDLKGMGTTVSAVGLTGCDVVCGQIGDSRAYILRNDEMVQITFDQSVVDALLSAGKIRSRDETTPKMRAQVLQAAGPNPDVDVSLSKIGLCQSDRLLVCSDGLTGPVSEQEIRRILMANSSPDVAVASLIAAALQRGAPDNVTVVVADVTGPDLPSAKDNPIVYREFDPAETGSAAYATSSRVLKRLAARAGIAKDTSPRMVPQTIQRYPTPPKRSPPSAEAKVANVSSGDKRIWLIDYVVLIVIFLFCIGCIYWLKQ